MTNKTTDINSYNMMLERSYALIYQNDPKAWGTSPNSDLVHTVKSRFSRALDVGCGYGKNLGHLLNYADQVVGIDLCSKAIDLARKNYENKVIHGNLELIHGDEDSISGKFDLIVCSGVIVDHLQERRVHFAKKIVDSLCMGGLLFLTVFGKNDPAYGVGEFIEEGTYRHKFGFPVHYFTQDELSDLFVSLSVNDIYTRQKLDYYPNQHIHETHVLIASKG